MARDLAADYPEQAATLDRLTRQILGTSDQQLAQKVEAHLREHGGQIAAATAIVLAESPALARDWRDAPRSRPRSRRG